MNNEPVAWISRLPEGDVYNCAWAEKQNDDDIPLYTHPVKEQDESFDRTASHMAGEYVSYKAELTDEEIEEFAYAFQLWQLHNPDKALEGIMDFARAILLKAQEK